MKTMTENGIGWNVSAPPAGRQQAATSETNVYSTSSCYTLFVCGLFGMNHQKSSDTDSSTTPSELSSVDVAEAQQRMILRFNEEEDADKFSFRWQVIAIYECAGSSKRGGPAPGNSCNVKRLCVGARRVHAAIFLASPPPQAQSLL